MRNSGRVRKVRVGECDRAWVSLRGKEEGRDRVGWMAGMAGWLAGWLAGWMDGWRQEERKEGRWGERDGMKEINRS
jgi:hypothetical protein